MTEQEQFDALVKFALENRTENPPENPNEFDIYSDMNYNLYMYIKGEWTGIGVNMTPLA